MSQRGKIQRYNLIIEKIFNENTKRDYRPNFKEIHQFLYSQGFEEGERTLSRDLQALRDEFNVDIICDNYKGYYIDNIEDFEESFFYKFLEIANLTELFEFTLKNAKQNLNYIDFEESSNLKGINNLKNLLEAISKHRYINFKHYNYYKDTISDYRIKPYLLKEYLNRWYVIGINENNKLRTFGVDRINELNIETKTFRLDKKLDIKGMFDKNIGLVYNNEKAEKVVLSFDPKQGQYIKSLPLHKSQKTLIDNENEFVIELYVYPNFELIQRILMQGYRVKVIEPKSLANEIKEELQEALENYTQ